MIKLTKKSRKMSEGQRISRKYKRAYQRRLQRREFNRLRKVVPSVAKEDDVSKVLIVQEATKYIQELHGAVSDKLKDFGFDVPSSDHNTLLKVLQMILPMSVPVLPPMQENSPYQQHPAVLQTLRYITPPSPHVHNSPSHMKLSQKSLRYWRI